jgi:hypothetical protein
MMILRDCVVFHPSRLVALSFLLVRPARRCLSGSSGPNCMTLQVCPTSERTGEPPSTFRAGSRLPSRVCDPERNRSPNPARSNARPRARLGPALPFAA